MDIRQGTSYAPCWLAGTAAHARSTVQALAVLLLLAACSAPGASAPPSLTAAPTLMLSPATPTLTLDVLAVPNARPAPTYTPLPDPIKFTFPMQAADPQSLWRAPLYPTPWEPSPQDHFYFSRPIGANEVNWPLARYRYGYLFYEEPHSGIDIPAPKGTPILAAGPGIVLWAGYGIYFMNNQENDPYGIAVAIRHDFGYGGKHLYTVYGHMDSTTVIRGQHVEGGQQIGVVGETGKVSGPHLHFELRVGEDTFFETRNPELWLSPPQGTGLLVGRVRQSSGELWESAQVKLFLKGSSYFNDWFTYSRGTVNSDDYYQENLVAADLSPGEYVLHLVDIGTSYVTPVTIRAGQVTYFTFNPVDKFVFGAPPLPPSNFVTPQGAQPLPLGTQTSP